MVASRSIAPGYLQSLGYEKRFHTAWTRTGHPTGFDRRQKMPTLGLVMERRELECSYDFLRV